MNKFSDNEKCYTENGTKRGGWASGQLSLYGQGDLPEDVKVWAQIIPREDLQV